MREPTPALGRGCYPLCADYAARVIDYATNLRPQWERGGF